jgi:hypothetical protein
MSNSAAAIDNNRSVLAGEKVYYESLPRSLNHHSRADALNEAKNLVHFLKAVAVLDYSSKDGVSLERIEQEGLLIVYRLILDKLDIGTGKYLFPFSGYEDSLPALAERKEE